MRNLVCIITVLLMHCGFALAQKNIKDSVELKNVTVVGKSKTQKLREGALSVNATAEEVSEAYDFGMAIGMIFQIRDDIFDYYDSKEIGKPTGNDMAEGKLTLPIIYALKSTGNEEMLNLAKKVKKGFVTDAEIQQLVQFAIQNGGIDYAVKKMDDFSAQAQRYIIFHVKQIEVKEALQAYLDFVANRNI